MLIVLEEIVDRTRKGGGKSLTFLVMVLLTMHQLHHLLKWLKQFLKIKNVFYLQLLILEGEYGMDGIYLGVPTVLGAGGIEKIIELELTRRRKSIIKQIC